MMGLALLDPSYGLLAPFIGMGHLAGPGPISLASFLAFALAWTCMVASVGATWPLWRRRSSGARGPWNLPPDR